MTQAAIASAEDAAGRSTFADFFLIIAAVSLSESSRGDVVFDPPSQYKKKKERIQYIKKGILNTILKMSDKTGECCFFFRQISKRQTVCLTIFFVFSLPYKTRQSYTRASQWIRACAL